VFRSLDERFDAEPYLSSLRYKTWRSPAQKEAAWTVLNTPAGSTRVIVLPTGAGKSLCFQLLPRFEEGLTVVVVPTVALAIDQRNQAADVLRDWPYVNPVYFASDEEPTRIVQQLRNRETRLLFTSPEACVSGRLRPVLDELAFSQSGDAWFKNLVIDEAHLIETWGAQFRVEFQLLAPRRRRWLESSSNRLRTFLFSATMTAGCRELLRGMFSEQDLGREFLCQRTRPEMVYFEHDFPSQAGRDAALLEALVHLPRPAILYVTEVDQARAYASNLKAQLGFQRIASFHGETRRADRRETLARWKANQIDLMVATSAFGVGVDKADVRAVIHACYPENLDRYYQEVGRGGRDGWSSICLFLPTEQDRRVARGLSVTLMTPDMLQKRWDAMYQQGAHVDGYRYRLPVNAKRSGLVGTYTYAENVRWNKRLLVQLHRAGLLELLEITREKPEVEGDDPEEWAEVRVQFPPDARDLGQRATEMRNKELATFSRGFDQLDELLAGKRCVMRIVQKLYGIPSHQRVCGGCPYCRQSESPADDCPPLLFAEASPGRQESVTVANWPDPFHPDQTGDFFHYFDLLRTRKHLRRFLVPEKRFKQFLVLFRSTVSGNGNDIYRVDPIVERLDSDDPKAIIATEPAETLVFLHVGKTSRSALQLGAGRCSVHLRCGFSEDLDADGRDIHVRQESLFFRTPQAWLTAS
jgi:ATP-dependent DNA helicase RecQ